MKHIKTFKKIADYTVYKSDLEHFIIPNISYVEETEGVVYKTIQSISNATITCDSATYDGQTHIATNIVVTLYGETLINGVDYTISGNNGGIDGGDYTFTVNGMGHYKDSKQGTFTINKLTPTVTTPTAKVLTFNGTAQELVNAGSTNYGTLKYSLDNSTWSTSIPTATNYGSYTVYYKVDGDSNINDVTVSSVQCSINEKQVTAIIELSEDTYTYDGTAKEPTVTVKDGSTVIDPSEYSVAYSNNINAGTATVTISDNVGGNYEVIGSATFTIGKAQGSVTTAPTAITGLTPTGSAQALVNAGSGTGTMMYNLNGGAWSSSIPTATNFGSYTVGYMAAESANYTESTTGSVSVKIDYPYEYVDLGLSVKWCTHNVGAKYDYQNGSYFSWANTTPHAKGSGYDFNKTTYNSTSGNSVQTNIGASSGYDMARANMGGSWRLPTKEEFQELYDNCTWTLTSSNGVNGYRITSKVAGYTSNSIFIPAVGYYSGTTLNEEGVNGNYWSSSLDSAPNAYQSSNTAYYLYFGSLGLYPQFYGARYFGFSVRAVKE